MDAVLTITPPPRARSIGATVLTPEEAVDSAEALGDRRGVAGHVRGPRHVGLDGEPHPAHRLDRGQRVHERETSTSPTRAPSAAKRTAAARPMPPAAPVISAILPSKRGPSRRGA